MTKYEPCVVFGAKLLDSYNPEWFSQVDVNRLNLGSCYDCVLGQLFGSYAKGLNELGIPESGRFEYGFSMDGFHPKEDWLALTNLWREQIAFRRLKVMAQEPAASK